MERELSKFRLDFCFSTSTEENTKCILCKVPVTDARTLASSLGKIIYNIHKLCIERNLMSTLYHNQDIISIMFILFNCILLPVALRLSFLNYFRNMQDSLKGITEDSLKYIIVVS